MMDGGDYQRYPRSGGSNHNHNDPAHNEYVPALLPLEEVADRIDRFCERYIHNGDAALDSGYVLSRLDAMEAEFASVLHGLLPSASGHAHIAARIRQLRSEVEDILFAARSRLAPASTAHPTYNAQAALAALHLPPFHGDYTEWPHFRSIVEDTLAPLPAAEKDKFGALLAALRGEPAITVASFALVDAPFTLAWEALTERYEDDRHVTLALIDLVLDTPSPTAPSELQPFVAAIIGATAKLRARAHPIDDSPLLVGILLRKLPAMLRQRFEEACPGQVMPTFEQVIKYLGEYSAPEGHAPSSVAQAQPVPPAPPAPIIHSFTLRRPSPSPSRPPPQPRPLLSNANHVGQTMMGSTHQMHGGGGGGGVGGGGAAPSTAPPLDDCCQFCQGAHSIRQCPRFKNLSCKDRRQYVQEARLCRNCLSSKHIAVECTSKERCHVCRESHHTILHKHGASQSTLVRKSLAKAAQQQAGGQSGRKHMRGAMKGMKGMKQMRGPNAKNN